MDRLIGLAGEDAENLVRRCSDRKSSNEIQISETDDEILKRISVIISKMRDPDIFPWIIHNRDPDEIEIKIATALISDRVRSSIGNADARLMQQARQKKIMKEWLEKQGYTEIEKKNRPKIVSEMPLGSFMFEYGVSTKRENPELNLDKKTITLDAVVMPHRPDQEGIPFLFELKSAGDPINPNKRQKEEITKIKNLQRTFEVDNLKFCLLLTGFFQDTYLNDVMDYGIDWVWSHRISDLGKLGLELK